MVITGSFLAKLAIAVTLVQDTCKTTFSGLQSLVFVHYDHTKVFMTLVRPYTHTGMTYAKTFDISERCMLCGLFDEAKKKATRRKCHLFIFVKSVSPAQGICRAEETQEDKLFPQSYPKRFHFFHADGHKVPTTTIVLLIVRS